MSVAAVSDAAGAIRVPQGAVLRARPREDEPEALLAHVTCTVVGAGCWLPVPPDWRLPGTTTSTYVAMLCVGGGARYRFRVAGGPLETFLVRAGDVLLAPPGTYREGSHDPADPLQLYSVHFHARLHGVLDMPAVFRLPVALRPLPEELQIMVEAAQRIVAELAVALPGYVLACNARCAELLARLWRVAAAQGVAVGRTAGQVARLAPALRTIETRYAEPLTLADLAGSVQLHPAYFSTLFRTLVGIPPLRYLSRYRLGRARELLLTSDLPLAAVAQRTGFADAAYFSRVFRAAEGTAPGAYRESKKNPIIA